MSKIIMGPFNRVEGDLELHLDLADGRVAKALVTAPLYRGFEQIMLGRPAMDALVVAPRVCGICSVSQSSAAAAALAGLAGMEMPPLGRLAANLVLATENMLDHLSHFYLFFMPDFARPDYAGRTWHQEMVERFQAMKGAAARRAVEARAAALHLVGILAGKWPHTLALQPGGMTKAVDLGERMRLAAVLTAFRAFLEGQLFADRLENIAGLTGVDQLAAWAEAHQNSDFGLFLKAADDLGLAGLGMGGERFLSYGAYRSAAGGHFFAPGLARAGAVQPLDLAGLTEDLSHAWMNGENRHPKAGLTQPDAEKAGAYSWCKAPRLGGESFETGAFARQMVAGHPLIRALAAAGQGRANVRSRVVARLLELALVVPEMERWAQQLKGGGAFCEACPLPPDGDGVGLVEAARGSLGHWLAIEDGRIAGYQIVAPTTWNFSPRDAAGQPGPVEAALAGTPVRDGERFPLAVQHVVRSFDPCMSCTVH